MDEHEKPLVSVITPSFNQARFLGETLRSVGAQDYEPVEHIVIDGGSTDGTLDILRAWGGRWISEPDEGQASAIAKGISMSRGDVIGWLNSDDVYLDGAISKAVPRLVDVDLVYGDARFIDAEGADLGPASFVEPFDLTRLINVTDYIVQPASFFTRRAYDSVGGIDPSLHWTLDYDLWIRLGSAGRVTYVPEVLALARVHGNAKTATGGVHRLDEIERMIRRHGRRTLPEGYEGEMAREAWHAGQHRRALPYLLRTFVHGGPRRFITAAARDL